MTKNTCNKCRNQNKSNIEQEKNKKLRYSKEGQIGYVYVRARRGEATDSHSLAERVLSTFLNFHFYPSFQNVV